VPIEDLSAPDERSLQPVGERGWAAARPEPEEPDPGYLRGLRPHLERPHEGHSCAANEFASPHLIPFRGTTKATRARMLRSNVRNGSSAVLRRPPVKAAMIIRVRVHRDRGAISRINPYRN